MIRQPWNSLTLNKMRNIYKYIWLNTVNESGEEICKPDFPTPVLCNNCVYIFFHNNSERASYMFPVLRVSLYCAVTM